MYAREHSQNRETQSVRAVRAKSNEVFFLLFFFFLYSLSLCNDNHFLFHAPHKVVRKKQLTFVPFVSRMLVSRARSHARIAHFFTFFFFVDSWLDQCVGLWYGEKNETGKNAEFFFGLNSQHQLRVFLFFFFVFLQWVDRDLRNFEFVFVWNEFIDRSLNALRTISTNYTHTHESHAHLIILYKVKFAFDGILVDALRIPFISDSAQSQQGSRAQNHFGHFKYAFKIKKKKKIASLSKEKNGERKKKRQNEWFLVLVSLTECLAGVVSCDSDRC